MSGLAVGSVDLDDRDALADQMPSNAGAVGAGSLDSDQADRAEAGEPRDELAVATMW